MLFKLSLELDGGGGEVIDSSTEVLDHWMKNRLWWITVSSVFILFLHDIILSAMRIDRVQGDVQSQKP